MIAMLANQTTALHERMRRKLEQGAQRLDRLSLKLVPPSQRIAAKQHQVAMLVQRLRHASPDIAALKQRNEQSALRLARAATQALTARVHRLEHLSVTLGGLSPTAPLERGYALVRDSQGKIVTRADSLQIQEELTIAFASGQAVAQVQSVSPAPQTRVDKKCPWPQPVATIGPVGCTHHPIMIPMTHKKGYRFHDTYPCTVALRDGRAGTSHLKGNA
jgi:exodeoxyribonuclease VII large subunit